MLPFRELQAVLAWSAVPWVGERTLLSLLEHARESRRSLADLWDAPLADLAALVELHPRSIAALEKHADKRWKAAGAEAETVRAWGVDLLTEADPDFPALLQAERVRPRRWPLLFAYGALELLEDAPRVALVNSRNVSTAGLAVTDAVADALARRDIPLVASPNKEAYQAAAVAAKRQAGPCAFALDRGMAAMFPDGLAREPVAPARVWDEAFDPDLQLLLSPFGWRQPWNPRSSPRRDALVFDLADLLVAVEVQPGGVMEQELRRALGLGKPVLLLDRGEKAATGMRELLSAVGDHPSATVLRWSGAEGAVGEVVARLPGYSPEREAREREGWRREVHSFLVRLPQRLEAARPMDASPPTVFPAGGELARKVITRYAGRAMAPGAGVDEARCGGRALLADLSEPAYREEASRVGQLLGRVPVGGRLIALLPAAWLDDPALERRRADWSRSATVLATVRLPGSPEGGVELAVLVMERRAVSETGRPVEQFAPQRGERGRFHLRRYLDAVMAGLEGSRP